MCSQTEAAGGGATSPSRKEEEPVSTVLYLSADLMDVNTDICQAPGHPPRSRERAAPRGQVLRRGLVPQTWLRMKTLLCSPPGPRWGRESPRGRTLTDAR